MKLNNGSANDHESAYASTLSSELVHRHIHNPFNSHIWSINCNFLYYHQISVFLYILTLTCFKSVS